MQSGSLVPYTIYHEYCIERKSRASQFARDLRDEKELHRLVYLEQIEFIRCLEETCYKAALSLAFKNGVPSSWNDTCFKKIYNHKCYCVIENLKQNINLLKKIIDKEMTIHQLVRANPAELRPDLYIEIQKKSELQLNSLPTLQLK